MATTSDLDYWPRLTRFYGLAPGVIARMPRCLIEVYLEQMSALQAEEQLAAAQASDMPHITESDRKKIYRQLQRLADLEPEPVFLNPLQAGGINALKNMGIKVVMEDA